MEKEKRIVYQESTELPPPGDARKDELARREDNLQQKAEELAAGIQAEKIDPKTFEPVRELQAMYDPESMSICSVDNPVPGRRYCWANYQAQSGIQVSIKKALGWLVLSGPKDSFPECWDFMAVDGSRRKGDVLLMWIPEDRAQMLEARDRRRAEARAMSSAKELEDLGDKMRARGLKVHTPNTEPSKYAQAVVTRGQEDPRAAMIRAQAGSMLGNALRNEIPGLPIPGKK